MNEEKSKEYEILSMDLVSQTIAVDFASALHKVANLIEGKKGTLRLHITFEEQP